MDRLGGSFGAHDDAGPFGLESADYYGDVNEDPAPHAPPSPVGQDERTAYDAHETVVGHLVGAVLTPGARVSHRVVRSAARRSSGAPGAARGR